MEAKKLYQRLEKDFIKPGLSDEWAEDMDEVKDFLSENFKRRSMGLVCDNSQEINRVYTAVFPTNEIMQKILDSGETDALLFVHHPSIWDITKAPQVFQQMSRELLTQFKERRISIYNLHVPLDNFGEYSTSTTLAKALGIKPEIDFAPYFGALCGIIGRTDSKNVAELSKKFDKAVEHKTSLYSYGDKLITGGRVAVIAGGGNDIKMLEEIAKNEVNTFITGITALNSHSQKAHDFAKAHKINVLGGTHYSTEAFACKAMCKYFEKLGLDCEFIQGKPGLEDL
jgi:putative NIF3 family GTP cyclohydrolase 1 type 2